MAADHPYIIIGALIPLAMRYYRAHVDTTYTPIVLSPEDVGITVE